MATDTLEDILVIRRKRVNQAKQKTPLGEMEAKAKASPTPLDFLGAVARPGWISLIAELKKKSPSAGVIRQPFDPSRIAVAYEKGGASALSVLTEQDMFGGDIADIARAKKNSRLPVLRKDFIYDPYQIVEARAHGADAILLIAEMLPPSLMNELAGVARDYGLEPLIEIFSEDVLEAALDTGAKLIGINSRNLRTLEMRPDNFFSLSPRVPADRYVVAESGIKTPADVDRLRALPIFGMLVGESLLKQQNLEQAARALSEAGAPSY